MSVKPTRVFITDATGIWIDWYSPVPGLSLSGQGLLLSGSGGGDVVYVGNATAVDGTVLGGGADTIYLQGNWADYTIERNGEGEYTLTGKAASGRTEVVKLAVGEDLDKLYFADGHLTVNNATLFDEDTGDYRDITQAMVTGAGTPAFPVTAPLQGALPTRVFVTDSSGENVPAFRAGAGLSITGNSGSDTVYVANGTQVNATVLGGGADTIYLQGNWADYTIERNGEGEYTLTGKAASGRTDVVRLVVGEDLDKLYFADGHLTVNNATLFDEDAGDYRDITQAMVTGDGTPGLDPAATITGVPTSPVGDLTQGVAHALVDLTLGDEGESVNTATSTAIYTLSLVATNGEVTGITDADATLSGDQADADPSLPGLQIKGNLSQIMQSFNAATFTPAAAGSVPTQIDLTLTDPAGNSTTATYAFAGPIHKLLAPGTPISPDQRAFQGVYSDTLAWRLPSGLNAVDASAALYSGSALVRGGTLSAGTSVTAVRVLAPDGSARLLGSGPSFEPVQPDSLSLDTGWKSFSGAQRLQGAFQKLDWAAGSGVSLPEFSGFTHLGTALQPDPSQPTYKATLAGTDWYLWQPQGWLGRYVLSTVSASAVWWVGGNSNGLGTGSGSGTVWREGVLRTGHWFFNAYPLNAWDSMFQTYWGLFTLSGTGVATEWALSLGQGHTVQPGDHLQIVTTSGAQQTVTTLDLPADITRPTLGTAILTALGETGQVLTASDVLDVGDVVRISVPLSEPVLIQTIQSPRAGDVRVLWPGLDNAVIALDIGGVSRSAWLNLDASLRSNGQQLVFDYTIANGDLDTVGGLRVGAIDNRFTRFADEYGNRLWTQNLDVAEVTNAWQVNASSSALAHQPYFVQALVRGSHWPDSTPGSGQQGDAATELNYVFLQAWPSYYQSGELPNAQTSGATAADTAFVPWTQGMKDLLTGVLSALSTYTRISFTEVSDPAQAHLAMGAYPMSSGVGGYGYFPASNLSAPTGNAFGDLWINSNANLSGAWIRYAIAHEVGHTLGLKHPGNYDAGGGGSGGPFLDNSTDNSRYSVMSYIAGPDLNAYPNDYMLYDIAALQYLYGVRDHNTGDTAISINYPSSSATINSTDAIYDTGGIDTLSVSGATGGVKLNLNQGEFCSIGDTDNFGICYGTVIENAIGTAHADLLIGNNANNTLTGGGGADTFVFGSEWGHDTLTDFVVGTDRISFARDATVTRESLIISVSSGNTVITHGSDTLTLNGVTAELPETAFQFVL